MRLWSRDRARSRASGERPLVYRSVAALALAAAALGVGVALTVDALVHDPGAAALAVVGAGVLGAALVVALAVRPAVIVRDTGMVLRNPLRDVVLPWACVQDIRLGLSLDVRAGGRWHHSFAVQASPRRPRQEARRADREPARVAGAGLPWAERVHEELQHIWAPHRDGGPRPDVASADGGVRVVWSAVMLGWVGVGLVLVALGLLLR
jgi:hypothetical protein